MQESKKTERVLVQKVKTGPLYEYVHTRNVIFALCLEVVRPVARYSLLAILGWWTAFVGCAPSPAPWSRRRSSRHYCQYIVSHIQVHYITFISLFTGIPLLAQCGRKTKP